MNDLESNFLFEVIRKAEKSIETLTSSNRGELYEIETSPNTINTLMNEALKAIVNSEKLINQISSHSYIHDNGFIKLVLFQANEAISEIRLHLWGLDDEHKSINTLAGNIHDHSANFTSYILRGSLTEEVYSIVDDQSNIEAIEAKEYYCSSRGENNYYKMEFKGLRKLICSSSRTFNEGEWHSLQNNILHRAYPSIKPTVTLFFQSPRIKRGTNSYDISGKEWSFVMKSKPLNSEETFSYLTKTMELLYLSE